MPVVGFQDLKGGHMTFNEGLEYFENTPTENAIGKDSLGIIPSEALMLMIDDDEDYRTKHGRLSPSSLDDINDPTKCRRDIYLGRFLDYYLNPMDLWEASEGTLLHKMFEIAGSHDKTHEYSREIRLPHYDGTRVVIDPIDNKPCYEIWPGVLMRGTIDACNGKILKDFKTERYPMVFGKKLPGVDYADGKVGGAWAIQTNIYRDMWERATGDEIEHIYVWRFYRGSRERTLTFRKFEVPIVSLDRIWKDVEPFVVSMLGYLKQGTEIEASGMTEDQKREAHLIIAKNIPMDGYEKKIFRGQKCSKYCSQREQCFGLAGMVDF